VHGGRASATSQAQQLSRIFSTVSPSLVQPCSPPQPCSPAYRGVNQEPSGLPKTRQPACAKNRRALPVSRQLAVDRPLPDFFVPFVYSRQKKFYWRPIASTASYPCLSMLYRDEGNGKSNFLAISWRCRDSQTPSPSFRRWLVGWPAALNLLLLSNIASFPRSLSAQPPYYGGNLPFVSDSLRRKTRCEMIHR
jgi:hypothetical protein